MIARQSPGSAPYVGRFAPSPTGPLHFGSLVAAIASYCDARAHRGRWLVRIEDIDEPRSQPDAESVILPLERYGFAWDEAPVRQSDRIPIYDAALERLRSRDLVYECACSRRDLELAPIGAGGERVYAGTCRTGIPADRRSRPQRAWRLRVSDAHVEFHDRLQGSVAQQLGKDVGDYVVKRADGFYAYQLAVVVDDAAQAITDVVRGADLLASTPRQIFLQRLLGFPLPSYLHAPVAIGTAGEKLSKQTNAAPLSDNVLPTLIAAWRFLRQELPKDSEAVVDVREFWTWAIGTWDPSRLPRKTMLPAPHRYEGTKIGRV